MSAAYPSSTGRGLALNCPLCGRETRVDGRGRRLHFRCSGGHKNAEITAALAPGVLIEIEDLVRRARIEAGAAATPTPAPAAPVRSKSQPPPQATTRPVDEPPATAELLDTVRDFITRFVVLPSEEAADLLALWTLHTHALEAARATPYLRITSATPNAGKSLVLELLAALCRNGWHAVGPSPAVLYRKIDRHAPTLCLDEIDNLQFGDRRDLLGVLNAGYRRGATIDRCGEGGELQEFSCFCPKAYAGLDLHDLPPALLSRSITIRMETKLARERVEMWLGAQAEGDADPEPLRDSCAQWASENVGALGRVGPTLPPGLANRSAEVWWSLLALAEHAGGDWPERARRAATVLSVGGDAADALSVPVQLLTDVRAAFGEDGRDKIRTADLLAFLDRLEESPWGARRHGQGLDAGALARMLRKFNTPEGVPIRPATLGSGKGSAKGYRLDDFADAFERHLPQPSHPSQPSHGRPHAERDATGATGATANPGVPQSLEPADGEPAQPAQNSALAFGQVSEPAPGTAVVELTPPEPNESRGAPTPNPTDHEPADDLSDLGPEQPLPDLAPKSLRPEPCEGAGHQTEPWQDEYGDWSCRPCGRPCDPPGGGR